MRTKAGQAKAVQPLGSLPIPERRHVSAACSTIEHRLSDRDRELRESNG
jgi:hypothetical protein